MVVVVGFAVVVAVGLQRYRAPSRPRRVDVREQRAYLEKLIPQAEEQLRREGVPEEEIAARLRQLNERLPELFADENGPDPPATPPAERAQATPPNDDAPDAVRRRIGL
jgi:hypothetical protein